LILIDLDLNFCVSPEIKNKDCDLSWQRLVYNGLEGLVEAFVESANIFCFCDFVMIQTFTYLSSTNQSPQV